MLFDFYQFFSLFQFLFQLSKSKTLSEQQIQLSVNLSEREMISISGISLNIAGPTSFQQNYRSFGNIFRLKSFTQTFSIEFVQCHWNFVRMVTIVKHPVHNVKNYCQLKQLSVWIQAKGEAQRNELLRVS